MIAYSDLDRALTEQQAMSSEWSPNQRKMLEAAGFVPEDVLAFARNRCDRFESLVETILVRFPSLPQGGAFEASLHAIWCDGLMVGARVRDGEHA